MNATSGKRAAVALALAAALASHAARAANPSPADVATARELYKKGADALDAGNAALAAERLAQAWALVQTPVIGYDLARAQASLGHLVEAREAALAVERLGVARDETARSTEARGDAGKLADKLEPRIPHVALSVEGLAGHEATVKLDGHVVPSAVLSVPRDANPGAHAAVVDTDDGRHAEAAIVLTEGETKSLVLRLDAPRVSTEPPAHPTPQVNQARPETPRAVAPVPPAETARAHPSPLVWAGVATSGVGLVLGGIAGAFAFSEAKTVHDHCSLVVGSQTVCTPPYDGDLANANALGVVSTVGFAVAGAGVALLVTGLVLGPSRAKASHAFVPFFGPITGVTGTF